MAAVHPNDDLIALCALWRDQKDQLTANGWYAEPNLSSQFPPGVIVAPSGHISSLELRNIELLPPEIGVLKWINFLHLHNGKLRTIPKEIGNMRKLTTLTLSNHKLSVLPTEVSNLTCLMSLHLDRNRFTTIQPEIAGLASLTALDLSHNWIQSVPKEIGGLNRLTLLLLNKNEIAELPREIGRLTSLKILKLSDNCLSKTPTSLPPAVSTLKAFKTSDLDERKQSVTRRTQSPNSVASTQSVVPASSTPPPLASWDAPTPGKVGGSNDFRLLSAQYLTQSAPDKMSPRRNPPGGIGSKTPASPSSQEEGGFEMRLSHENNPKALNRRSLSVSSLQPSSSSHPSTPISPPPASVIDMKDVDLREVIGKGSQGEVWIGDWLGTDVVMKIIKLKEGDSSSGALARELALIWNLRHPHIVSLLGYEFGVTNVKIVMEYMAGSSLDKVLYDEKVKVSWGAARNIGTAVAKALARLHGHKPALIHRELRSSHVLLDVHRTTVKVCDAGLGTVSGMTSATMMKTLPSSLPWIAPEMMSDGSYNEKVDVYSFGIIMWEMANRQRPYKGLSPANILFGVPSGKLRPSVSQDTPSAWNNLMQRCWSKDPFSRPSFRDILREMKRLTLPDGPIGYKS